MAAVDLLEKHRDAIPATSKFGKVVFGGRVEWDLSHLEPFAFTEALAPDLNVVVVVLFSCHCFTCERPVGRYVPESEMYRDGREARVLDPERYRLSRAFLPKLIHELRSRHIRVASAMPNFFTWEDTTSEGKPVHYAVFFEVTKDKQRGARLLLRVQSAYPIDALNHRMKKAGKVRLATLLRATLEGRKIKG